MSALTELMSTDEEFIRSFGDLSSLARCDEGSPAADLYSRILDLLTESGMNPRG